MKSCELVTFVTAVACNMASCYTEEELTLLSAVFSQLGDTLATILTNESLLSSEKDSCSDDTKTKCKEEKTDEEEVEKEPCKEKEGYDLRDESN